MSRRRQLRAVVARHAALRRRDGEAGVVLVWLALMMIVLLGMGALAIDVARLRHEQTAAQKAADAAALAGAVNMPDAPNRARTDATDVATKNGYTNGIDGATVTVEPGSESTGRQVKVTVSRNVKNFLAGVLGISRSTVHASATADYERPEVETRQPIDVVMIVDRTQSLDSGEFATVKTAANSVLTGVFDPAYGDHVALGLIGPSLTNSTCGSGAYGNTSSRAGSTNNFQTPNTWIVAPYPWGPLTSDYRNASSQIRRTITCMNQTAGTDLASPVAQATTYLNANARAGSRRVIMLMTDGFPQPPDGTTTNTTDPYTCRAAVNAANAAKNEGITVVTIGYGVGGAGTSTSCKDSGSLRDVNNRAWANQPVADALATMASPVNGVPAGNQCSNANTENNDGDNFFCGASSSELIDAFQSGASTIVGDPAHPRLIK